MPSHLHEALLQLFRNRPQLAPELLRDALHVPLPEYTEARIESADLNDIQPTEYRADLVVLLLDGQPVLGIVVEVQLARDETKHYVWPVYVANLRARIFPLYLDLVLNSLTEAARRALQAMDPAKYEFQSDFAKRFIAVGKEEGEAEGLTKGRIEGRVEGRVEGELEGRIKLVLRLLGLRYGPLSDAVQAQVRALDGVQLDALAERILRATSLDEVLRDF